MTAPGSLVVSFDTELIWGSFDHTTADGFERRYPDVRGTIGDLLQLLDRYQVPVTWAVLGHLFLARCERGADGRAHPELIHPQQRWFGGPWLAADPCTDRARDPLWYGDDILDAIQGARTAHEIGCHSFSHALFDDPDLTQAAVRSDLDACRRVAATRGIELRSFAFPRNREGHHRLLRDAGFVAFRGADPTWYRSLPGVPRRAAHFADQIAALPPAVSHPVQAVPGLWNVPGSMLLLHRSGMRRVIPIASRIAKARLGLRRAVRSGAVFHLWTHPFNLASDRAGLLGALEAILRDAVALREGGRLRIETMGEVAARQGSADRGAA